MVISYLDKARAMAKKSPSHQFKVGAVIANGSHILGMGRNHPLDHKNRLPGYRSSHAEFDAVFKSRGDIRGATIYVVVINSGGNDTISRPCYLCMNLLRTYGVATVVYSRRGIMTEEKIS